MEITIELCRALFDKYYSIMVEDTGRTFNINMHTFECFAISDEEAVGKMYLNKPEFMGREIIKITAI